ncbi:MAG: glycoside hydrolase family 9 protein [Longimicrobiales bacterium]
MSTAALWLAFALGTGTDSVFIRVNQLGYLPDAPKIAVVCALRPLAAAPQLVLRDIMGRELLRPRVTEHGDLAGCRATYRVDFSAARAGDYHLVGAAATSPRIRVARDVYEGAADSLLVYLRQQRSRWNPLFRDSVHARDAILVDHPDSGSFIAVSGGWFDAADYLQYVTTSATATFMLLQAWRDHAHAFGDAYGAEGLPGANGVPDVLDEARWGLDWLLRMMPRDDLLLHQIADDRDHSYWDLPTTDSSDYGWGKGGYRPVYPCTGHPQGLFERQNRSSGLASAAGKFAAAFALGARLFGERGDVTYADSLARKAHAAYALGRSHPGVCQTAPGRAAYFYEEANWADDMELAAAQLLALSEDARFAEQAIAYARMEPMTPWMGRDTARHYEFYPWHNNGHYEIWAGAGAGAGGRRVREEVAAYYREGLRRVVARAGNGFAVGIPFIWCSNDLMASFATQALFYRRMTGDSRYREHEEAAVDWLLGTNPWGTSMIIGVPRSGDYPVDPHSVIAKELGVLHTGAVVDGPVYRTIFESLAYVRLAEEDEYAAFNTGRIVYHDDVGDYSTNEPVTDITANLLYLLAARAGAARTR